MGAKDTHTVHQRVVARAIILGVEGCLVQEKFRPDRGTYYGLPGGAREDCETLIEALQREAQEEIGCQLLVPALVGVADYRRREESGAIADSIECLFTARLPDGYTPRNGPKPDTHQRGVRWLPFDQLASLTFSPPYLREVIARLAKEPALPLGYLGAFADPRLGTDH